MRTRAVGTVLALALCAPVTAAHADTVLVENAHSGGHYAATNTTSSGGGIYQDVALDTSAGQLVCASAWLRTQLPATGAAGTSRSISAARRRSTPGRPPTADWAT